MDTTPIESIIADLCSDQGTEPELNDLLEVVSSRRGIEAGPKELERGVKFVRAYIGQVPYMMKIAWTAAGNVGLQAPMQQILRMVESYWIEGDDVIPDGMGIIGLLDDAYCSLTSLQAVSDHFRLQTGKHLFPTNLGAANKAMRNIIGEPYASELDRIVIRTMAETGLVEAVKSMASEEKQLNFAANSTIWSHGPAGELDMADLQRLGLLKD
ncbi:MAG: hypothetical protein HKN57_10930 [Xanthomonadales bacterium]|nr:hypothetical protein [Gammaproteobacteria bacterium]MBT8052561.1 hypothetical protein [Gammaproteobacteria bacterium]NND57758.1 hypothetical protein [Xanthomonadales bacterium]NNK51473.1 hypothetical protein [Xanthomonadales bacterium]